MLHLAQRAFGTLGAMRSLDAPVTALDPCEWDILAPALTQAQLRLIRECPLRLTSRLVLAYPGPAALPACGVRSASQRALDERCKRVVPEIGPDDALYRACVWCHAVLLLRPWVWECAACMRGRLAGEARRRARRELAQRQRALLAAYRAKKKRENA